MKKRGILHAQLISCIAALGHKDTYMIGDAGMPIPPGVQVIDLAVTAGVPTFRQVMDAVLEEAVVEGYTLADEIMEKYREHFDHWDGTDSMPDKQLRKILVAIMYDKRNPRA